MYGFDWIAQIKSINYFLGQKYHESDCITPRGIFFSFNICKMKVNCKHILTLISMLFSENIIFSVFLLQVGNMSLIYK